MKEVSTTKKGISVEHNFFAYCLENGYNISTPLSPDVPYDCILDINNKLLKLQIKRGNCLKYRKFIDNRIFEISFISSHLTSDGSINKTYSKEDIDGFISWCEEIPQYFFYIPIEKANKSAMRIYYGDNPTFQQNYYKDYILDFKKM